MMPSGDDVPTTIVCHFDEPERVEIDDDIMTDGLDVSMSLRSSLNDSYHPIDDRKTAGATATDAKNDHVTDQELCAMKDMVASMRRNPELLNLSPVMQKACLTSSPHPRRTIEDSSPPGETYVAKNEDLSAMKDMIASIRKNPLLLYQSPIMQKACATTTNTTTAVTHGTSSSLISHHETTPPSSRRPLGTKFDPSTLPTLPLPTARGVSINNKKSAVKAPSSPTAVSAPSSVMKMDTNTQLSKIRPRSI